MTAFANFRAMARGVGQQTAQEHSILPDTSSPGVSITALFGYQSYFDDTLLEKALLPQSVNQPIVDNSVSPTLQANIPGYTFGLHPSSQTPVAVQPLLGGQGASPQAIVLHPGQIYRPHGRPWGRSGNFSGFKWGLPFGWLGGGLATLYVFPSPDADAAWPGNAEVLFHRQRMQIYGTLPLTSPLNWPLRFPWPEALRGASSIPQAGSPVISIAEPTKTLMSLRQPDNAATADMRMLFWGDNDFDLDATGAIVTPQSRWVDYTWGTYVVTPTTAGTVYDNSYPVVTAPDEINRIAADNGGLTLLSMDGSIEDFYVDVVRYGRL